RLPSDPASRRAPLPRLAVPVITARRGLAPPSLTSCLAHKKGACLSARPQEGCYLLLDGVVGVEPEGAASGGGGVGGTTVGLARLRNGWMPNWTSLSLPL